ncbi:T9SS type A sorting domain-containing protein [Flavicella sediminum]|uniref:T9SS type A sorting domain-containing protein n=1 Tax=Flavicella sediminum TaxID=2585141 RepID=UPI00112319C8|nr:T9SS type A sorting domain-containing protein [Flavicella sediminum]
MGICSLKEVKVALLFLFFSMLSFGQTIEFTKRTGTDNPLDTADVGTGINSASVDIDNDGDFDLFIGNLAGTIRYYKNISTEENPNVFEEQEAAGNPLALVAVGANSSPTFTDLDDDGDYDVFVGSGSGISYFKNEGTITTPIFVLKTGSENPLSGLVGASNHSYSTSFVDIDADMDLDCFIGWIDYESADTAGIYFYKNNGTEVAPVFENQLNAENPFRDFNELYPNPVFLDMDADEDLDVFIGKGNGTYSYYENTTEAEELGLDNIQNENVHFFPNPAVSDVTFVVQQEFVKVELFSLSGLLVYSGQITKETPKLNIQNFADGIYILRLQDGENKIVKKLVISK